LQIGSAANLGDIILNKWALVIQANVGSEVSALLFKSSEFFFGIVLRFNILFFDNLKASKDAISYSKDLFNSTKLIIELFSEESRM
jgi:hypothetical protein